MYLNQSTYLAPTRPQNISCPASGTYAFKSNPTDTDNSVRGVIVAPPSGNTPDIPNMTILHQGFDTLALAIEANIGPELHAYLETEKTRADKERRDVLINYNGVEMLLKPHGGNGYSYIASGGPDGATWFFKKPNAKDKWGIRLSFGSFFMALHGIHAAKAHCEHVMERLGIRYAPHQVSISRIDFCIDILAKNFTLIPENFVMHSSTGRRDHITADDVSVNGKSGRTTSVTVGQSRNRQVIIYDKTSEIAAKGKSHWWQIWHHNLYENPSNCTKYDDIKRNFKFMKSSEMLRNYMKNHKSSRIWRTEFRAGKDLLKDRWGIRTWEQLFEKFGDLCREMGAVIRYTEPQENDPNRARWPNHLLWEIACAEINRDLINMRSGADPNPLKEVHREQHISLIFRNILGSSIALAALKDANFENLPKCFDELAKEMNETVSANAEKTKKQLREAGERYLFISKSSQPTYEN
ncbi:hypothetical protein [Paramylibacter kogurei]|nr:hypothetical protein [Amylibacter kogurei]